MLSAAKAVQLSPLRPFLWKVLVASLAVMKNLKSESQVAQAVLVAAQV